MAPNRNDHARQGGRGSTPPVQTKGATGKRDPERNPTDNEQTRTDPERTQIGARTDPQQIPNGPQTDPPRTEIEKKNENECDWCAEAKYSCALNNGKALQNVYRARTSATSEPHKN